jgi:hypothetical protein
MWNRLTLAEFEAVADEFDAEVARTPGIDRFCSSSAWIVSAALALMPPRRSFVLRGTHGWLACMLRRYPDGRRLLEPLELAWGLACPLVGRDPGALAAAVVGELAARRDWDGLVLAGLPEAGGWRQALAAALGPRLLVDDGPPAARMVASLDGGLDGWLSRRSRNFRKALRATLRDAERAGVVVEAVRVQDGADAAALYERILAVEARSWKHRDGVGILDSELRGFYAEMLPRLARTGRQRTLFARLGDRDVAYCLGAVFDGDYRGLQFSFDREHEALSLGSLLQYHQLVELCEAGVRRYDLGQEMEYKARWAEERFETSMLVIFNR